MDVRKFTTEFPTALQGENKTTYTFPAQMPLNAFHRCQILYYTKKLELQPVS